MEIKFSKYQGTGNDFVLIDNRLNNYQLTKDQIHYLCDRRFGIGGDGLMLLENEAGVDFKMIYYNSDGGLSTMCGNGGRCISQFAIDLGISSTELSFNAIDGLHHSAKINDLIELGMSNVKSVQKIDDNTFVLNTGSPHYVKLVPKVDSIDVKKIGAEIRYSESFKKEGINVNFMEILNETDSISVRTYERGVEDETYSCGTGVVACAIVKSIINKSEDNLRNIIVNTLGGPLKVSLNSNENMDAFFDIKLIGPAKFVFQGIIKLD